ncbi:unnamed protein product [Prorocentrum cordatum]|uniref:Uncharacterized protein n=1 Tax=Prorocentrum cordatum TaxID=2364126 RepID=A0ABN9WJP9_9DINO|nr:unnamed protein product [Polarella glacialis]
MAEEPAPAEAPAAEAPAPAAPAAPPQLTKAQAAEILDKVIEEAKNEELVKEVKAILEDVKKTHPDDPMAQQMQKARALPIVHFEEVLLVGHLEEVSSASLLLTRWA